MTIYVCRVDGKTFWNEAECHYHVDLYHAEWGHAVCIPGTPPPLQCVICDEIFQTQESCEQHIMTKHDKTGDLSSSWRLITADPK